MVRLVDIQDAETDLARLLDDAFFTTLPACELARWE